MSRVTASRPDDEITRALQSIEAALRVEAAVPLIEAGDSTFTVYNREAGLACPDGTGLPREVADREAERMNREHDAMMLLVRAYVDGEVSSYGVRVSRITEPAGA